MMPKSGAASQIYRHYLLLSGHVHMRNTWDYMTRSDPYFLHDLLLISKRVVADVPGKDLINDTNTDFNLINDLETLTLRLELPVVVCA